MRRRRFELTGDNAVYFGLCDAFGKRPGESLADAAKRALRRTPGRKHAAARAVLVHGATGEDRWEGLRRADRILRGVAS